MTSKSSRGIRAWLWVELASLAALLVGALILGRTSHGLAYTAGGCLALVGMVSAGVALVAVCVLVARQRWSERLPGPTNGGPRLVRSRAEYTLDSGMGPSLLGIAFAIFAIVVKVGAPGIGPVAGWWVLANGLAMGVVGVSIGTRRRKAFRAERGVWRNPTKVRVPVEPFDYISRSTHPGHFLREPAVMMVFASLFLGFVVGLVANPQVRANGGAALVVVVVIFGACFLGIMFIGVRRLVWFRSFKNTTGHAPW